MAHCYGWSNVVCLSVCLLVTFVSTAKNGCTNQSADWRVDAGGPKEPCIDGD